MGDVHRNVGVQQRTHVALNAGKTGYPLIGRNHFGVEAVLRKVLSIQRHDEIRLAVFGAITDVIVVGVGRNVE